MQKLIFIILSLIVITWCSNNQETTQQTDSTTTKNNTQIDKSGKTETLSWQDNPLMAPKRLIDKARDAQSKQNDSQNMLNDLDKQLWN